MMGERQVMREALFYGFSLKRLLSLHTILPLQWRSTGARCRPDESFSARTT